MWNVSKYGVLPGPYFAALGLNTERYFVFLSIQSQYGKIRTRKNSVFGQFLRSVTLIKILKWIFILIQIHSLRNYGKNLVPLQTEYGFFQNIASSFLIHKKMNKDLRYLTYFCNYFFRFFNNYLISNKFPVKFIGHIPTFVPIYPRWLFRHEDFFARVIISSFGIKLKAKIFLYCSLKLYFPVKSFEISLSIKCFPKPW